MQTLKAFLLYLASVVVFNLISILGLFVQIPRHLILRKPLSKYFYNLAIGEDQRGGSYLYGTEDYTISSYTYYLSKKNKYARYFKNFIDFFAYLLAGQKEHCKKSFEKEYKELHHGGAKFFTYNH